MIWSGLVKDEKSAEAVRRYLMQRGEDWWLYAGTVDGVEYERFIKALSLREMLDVVKVHGTAEDRKTILRMLMPWASRFERLDKDQKEALLAKMHAAKMREVEREAHDPNWEERQANIARADRDFNSFPQVILEPNIPEGPSWANFDVRYHEDSQTGHDAVRRWTRSKGPPIVRLGGPPGGGKTHLAVSAATALAAAGYIVVYRREQDLVDDLRQRALGDKTDQAALTEYGLAPWLVLDEFGGARDTPFASEVLDQLIDYRWRGAESGTRRTLVTTNLFPDDHDVRIASRMADTRYVETVRMAVPDYRRRVRG